jgi:hypothetical protein
MTRLLTVLATLAIALAGAASADAKVIKTNWSERVGYASGKGFIRLYVRKIEVTRSSWKAWVGLTNSASIGVQIKAEPIRPNADLPFTYWAGPGIWWSSYVSGGHWWPGSGTVLTRSARAAVVRPGYPTTLGPRKSWFGTFGGSLAKVPKDRLLRIGFGTLELPGNVRVGTGYPPRRLTLSTTHQFRLPRTR